MDNKDIAKEWFDIADTDLTSAEFLQKMQTDAMRDNLLPLSTSG